MRLGGFMEHFHRRALRHFVVQLAQLPHRLRFVGVHIRHAAFRRTFHFADIGHQQGVVGGHRTPAFGEDARRCQAFAGAGFGQRLHDAGGVMRDAVIDRVVACLLYTSRCV